MQRIRVVASLAAAALITMAVAPIAGVVDRVLPHEVQPWDMTLCTSSTMRDHALIGVAGPVPERGGAPVTILEVRPLGLQRDVGWRPWVLPEDGTLALSASPSGLEGWSERTVPGDAAEATAERPVQLFVELWPLHGDHPTAMHGVLVRYRTSFGLVRQAITPTSVSTRPGGCA